MLEITNLNVAYGHLQVLWDVSLTVEERHVTVIIGSNGAGKTTTLKTSLGLLKPLAGNVLFMGEDVHLRPIHQIVARGLSLVPEDRLLFPDMTVLENLELGSFAPEPRRRRKATLDWVYELFPRVRDRKKQKVRTLSGGEQQMVAVGRALMAKPKLLMLDEPSLGLAPLIVQELFRTIRKINQEGISILLVEQNVQNSLELAHRAYVIENGRITSSGTGREFLKDTKIREAYLGL